MHELISITILFFVFYYNNNKVKCILFLKKWEEFIMRYPNLNNVNINYNTKKTEPSDDDLKRIEEEVKKLLYKDFN